MFDTKEALVLRAARSPQSAIPRLAFGLTALVLATVATTSGATAGGQKPTATAADVKSVGEPAESRLLEASIRRVWNEHDDTRRLASMREIYRPDATIFEPARAVTGQQAISDVVRDVRKDMPPGFTFRVVGPTLGHHGVATTRWEGGPGDKVIVSGVDVVRIKDGLILEHYFYFDPPPQASTKP